MNPLHRSMHRGGGGNTSKIAAECCLFDTWIISAAYYGENLQIVDRKWMLFFELTLNLDSFQCASQ